MRSGPSWKKKEKHCDPSSPEAEEKGDQWDHTAIDVDSRLMISCVIGKRNRETLVEVVKDFANRTGNRPPRLTTTDDCSSYPDVLLEQYGETVVPEKTGRPGRPREPYLKWPRNACYATVKKTYKKGSVASTRRELVYGTPEDLAEALEKSSASTGINTAFMERQNGTDRSYNARKARKTYEFSKDLLVHMAVSFFVMVCYNFHHLNRGLRLSLGAGQYLNRTPAMAKGLADRPWTVRDILETQVVGFVPPTFPVLADLGRRSPVGPAP